MITIFQGFGIGLTTYAAISGFASGGWILVGGYWLFVRWYGKEDERIRRDWDDCSD